MDLMDPNTPTRRGMIDLRIDELILHGFAARDRHRIAAAIELELSRLIAEQGMQNWHTMSANLDHLDAGSFQLTAGARPQIVGQHVAQHIFRQLSPASARSTEQRSNEIRTANPIRSGGTHYV